MFHIFIIFNKREIAMNTNFILTNIIIPFLTGCIVCTLIWNAQKIAELAIWFFSFKERESYHTIMNATPILVREYKTGEFTMYMYEFENSNLSATVITNDEDNCVKLGIFNDANECLYSRWYKPYTYPDNMTRSRKLNNLAREMYVHLTTDYKTKEND